MNDNTWPERPTYVGVDWTVRPGDPFPDEFDPEVDTINGEPYTEQSADHPRHAATGEGAAAVIGEDEAYCWNCGNTGEVREQPADDLSGYVECPCVALGDRP